jgi:hypothetical protein
VLKDYGAHDAIAAAWRYNSKETLAMLSEWADCIVVMQPGGVKYLAEQFRQKIKVCDVGPDRWRSAVHPELTDICMRWSRSEGLVA